MEEKKDDINSKIDNLTKEIQDLRKMLARGTRNNIKPPASSGSMKLNVTELVLKDISEHPGTVRKEIAERLKLPPEKITKSVSDLAHEDKLIRMGARRTTRWFTPESLDSLTRKTEAK